MTLIGEVVTVLTELMVGAGVDDVGKPKVLLKKFEPSLV